VWGDFQCPYCGKFTRETEPRLYSDYVIPGKLKIVYRDWVFIGPESVSAAVAARCAGDQGNFWPYHDYLSWNQHGENQGAFSRDRLDAIAAALGLDLSAFRSCMAESAAFDAVKAETEAGSQAGIGMTPTLVVDGHVMPGAVTTDAKYAFLRSVIDASIAAHLTGAGAPSPTEP
jgi:protein-disulfide isomerase